MKNLLDTCEIFFQENPKVLLRHEDRKLTRARQHTELIHRCTALEEPCPRAAEGSAVEAGVAVGAGSRSVWR